MASVVGLLSLGQRLDLLRDQQRFCGDDALHGVAILAIQAAPKDFAEPSVAEKIPLAVELHAQRRSTTRGCLPFRRNCVALLEERLRNVCRVIQLRTT